MQFVVFYLACAVLAYLMATYSSQSFLYYLRQTYATLYSGASREPTIADDIRWAKKGNLFMALFGPVGLFAAALIQAMDHQWLDKIDIDRSKFGLQFRLN